MLHMVSFTMFAAQKAHLAACVQFAARVGSTTTHDLVVSPILRSQCMRNELLHEKEILQHATDNQMESFCILLLKVERWSIISAALRV